MGRYGAPFFCAFHALAVDDSGSGAGRSSGLFAALHIKRMMDILQRAVVGPKIEIIVERANAPRKFFVSIDWEIFRMCTYDGLGPNALKPIISTPASNSDNSRDKRLASSIGSV